jgi:hypothetical protein
MDLGGIFQSAGFWILLGIITFELDPISPINGSISNSKYVCRDCQTAFPAMRLPVSLQRHLLFLPKSGLPWSPAALTLRMD